MSKYISFNGELLMEDKPVLTVKNRAFRYGDGLFETIKAHDYTLLFLDDHLRRLEKGAEMIGLKTPQFLNSTWLYNEAKKIMQRSRLKDTVVRLALYRKGGGRYTPVTNEADVIISIDEAPGSFGLNKKGLSVDVYTDHLKPITQLGGLKSSNALYYVLASNYKRLKGLDEAILVNESGHVCEGTSSNVFVLMKQKLITPGVTQGCVPGVMRKQVIEIAKKGGIEVLQSPIHPETLNMADEVFFTNCSTGIRWVLAYRNKRFFNKFSSQLVEYLNQFADAEVERINSDSDPQENYS